MLKVAARFGVSSSYMARVCTRAPSGLSNGGKRRIATSQPRILCDWNSRKSPELMGLLTEFVVDYRRKGLSSEYFPFYYAVIRRMDPSIMSDRVGLYLVVSIVIKWGVRCLDCITMHNRAGPCPVKIPKRFRPRLGLKRLQIDWPLRDQRPCSCHDHEQKHPERNDPRPRSP